MTIVGIVAAVAIPALDGADAAREGAAARMLLHDLTWARSRSVATGTVTWVVFDADAETWSILSEDPADAGREGAGPILDPATGDAFVERLGSGSWATVGLLSASFADGAEVGFDWLGRPLVADDEILAETGSVVFDGGMTVVVEAGTGHARREAP